MYQKLHYESYKDLYKIIGDEHHDNITDIMHRHYFQIAGITVCVEYGVFPEPVQFKKELMGSLYLVPVARLIEYLILVFLHSLYFLPTRSGAAYWLPCLSRWLKKNDVSRQLTL